MNIIKESRPFKIDSYADLLNELSVTYEKVLYYKDVIEPKQ